MSSLKSIVATMTLLAIGYGANFFMNQPVPMPESDSAWGIGQLRPDRIPNNRPQIDLPPLQPAQGVQTTGPEVMNPTSNGQVANPFASGADPGLASSLNPTANNPLASLPPLNAAPSQSPASLPVPQPLANTSSTTPVAELPSPFPVNAPPTSLPAPAGTVP